MRWWDGQQWTEHTRPVDEAQAGAPTAAAQPAQPAAQPVQPRRGVPVWAWLVPLLVLVVAAGAAAYWFLLGPGRTVPASPQPDASQAPATEPATTDADDSDDTGDEALELVEATAVAYFESFWFSDCAAFEATATASLVEAYGWATEDGGVDCEMFESDTASWYEGATDLSLEVRSVEVWGGSATVILDEQYTYAEEVWLDPWQLDLVLEDGQWWVDYETLLEESESETP